MLFSEPKIPQCASAACGKSTTRGFSALQRAENSSIDALRLLEESGLRFSALQRAENSSIVVALGRRQYELCGVSVLFSEPKIPQLPQIFEPDEAVRSRFSALQRAENSSIYQHLERVPALELFQCSSASRKFLNYVFPSPVLAKLFLFQCSSASRKFLNCGRVEA